MRSRKNSAIHFLVGKSYDHLEQAGLNEVVDAEGLPGVTGCNGGSRAIHHPALPGSWRIYLEATRWHRLFTASGVYRATASGSDL